MELYWLKEGPSLGEVPSTFRFKDWPCGVRAIVRF